MDDDRFRKNVERLIGNIVFNIIKLILLLCSNLNVTNIYLFSIKCINNIIEKRLLKEGYYMRKVYKGVYLVHPVLYNND